MRNVEKAKSFGTEASLSYRIALNLRNLPDDPYEPDGYFTPGFHAIISASYTW